MSCRGELQNLWRLYALDVLPFGVACIAYVSIVAGFGGIALARCQNSQPRALWEEDVNVAAAASSLFLACATLSVRRSQWLPTRVYGLVLSVLSFGFWWTRCWLPYKRYGLVLGSLVPVYVADGCVRNYKFSAVLQVIVTVYSIATLASRTYAVEMRVSTVVTAVVMVILLLGYIAVAMAKRVVLPPLNTVQLITSVTFLSFAGVSLAWADETTNEAWWQPVSIAHLCGGIALYVSSCRPNAVLAPTANELLPLIDGP